MEDNIRGYAYVALRNGYERTLTWDWAAALLKDGSMPDRYEYIEDGLTMFDSSCTTATTLEEAKAMIDTIIGSMSGSLKELLKGKHSYPGSGGVVTRYDTTLDVELLSSNDEGEVLTIGNTIPEHEQGYDDVDNAEEMRARIRMLAPRLRPADMAVIMSYVDGTYDTLTEACTAGDMQYGTFTKRMRVATRGMVLA